jgi:hypothetical protein
VDPSVDAELADVVLPEERRVRRGSSGDLRGQLAAGVRVDECDLWSAR